MDWYKLPLNDIFKKVETNEAGLGNSERGKRLAENGSNVLTKGKEDSELKKFFKHFNDLLIYVLIVAGILKGIVGSYIEMVIIFIVVIINAIIGYSQERKATNSLNSLTSMLSEEATILSENKKEIVPADSLVVGDVVLLGPGDIIPADLRIIEAYNLVVEEAILTGESTPVTKNSDVITEKADLGDRLNMVFSGTLVGSGSGKGIVTETGDDTELGKISRNLKEMKNTETPLIKKMKQLNKQVFYILSALIVFLLFYSIFYHDFSMNELVSALIALAVSAVPEGLPAVLSIILSLGVTRMAKEKAIIKKMPAVETLGSMSVICSDKTGTLTKNEMSVVSVITKDEVSDHTEKPIELRDESLAFRRLVEIALYCNDTKIDYHDGKREVIGNPTEGALLELANRANLSQDNHLIYKIPFDSLYKYMAVLVTVDGENYIYLKGAPDVILGLAKQQVEKDTSTPLDLEYWESRISEFASKGQRVLAAAYKKVSSEKEHLTHEDLHNEMIFAGLYGIIDPPKKEAIEAVGVCREAGISVKMITGDHKDTAIAIAEEIGIENYNNALVGSEIEGLSDKELRDVVADHDVFARTTPEHKLRLVTAIQENGHVVGMTGDGVNDAPALKKADIGIAMGIKGTQVTKDASDMVLADDNFATIVKAVKEGRRVYDNLKKTIYFALPTAFAQGLLVVVSLLANMPLPLTSVQILWLNMVTTITLSFALGFEPYANDLMKRKPRDPKENILDSYAIIRVAYVSVLIAVLGFAVEAYLRGKGVDTAVIQTTLLQTIVFGQAFYMINCRELIKFPIDKGILKNNVLWGSLAILLVLQAIVIYVPVFHTIMETTALNITQLGISLLAGLGVFVVVEIEKWIYRLVKK
ncbi:HAD-IC family P-type ATPase [Listeria fleischmannii]|uniref:HAD-IC family P-type ATPase n=1 Tax=Listeria fleischmannii TaxID=1069827 RepID=A0A841YF95_9LIST|nr:HAD-IC family P-type ATPase [Listeria fleischmannii]MBC1399055.1 HAD-IC family P-type ATPase [Listeria fleischmannii]MBC1420027.1 HAD-IC family P-type ATPase [Listeria fleischmannii]MBC1427308.1 HAD-IC family P-type ATPase [Listeria fleischmannii]